MRITRITRLHLIVILMVMAAIGLFISEIKSRRPAKIPEEKKEILVSKLPAVVPPVAIENKEPFARKAIAVAGEYWKIAKKEYRDYERGGMTLKSAKREYQNGNYEEAWQLARLSIEQFKTAKKFGVKYRVKSGDCLWNIAKMKRHYGRGSLWVRIWRANEKIIKDFDLIFSRQVFFIPGVKRQNG
ncbi:MAG: LysM peptidoglycan-binding domain-containing protein [Elusimicrobiota bacterium]